MRKISLLIILMLSALISNAQTNTFPNDGNVGIGTTNPQFKTQIVGGHYSTTLNLHMDNPVVVQQADLTLWASEPGLTWSGTGIGNNVTNGNSPSTPGITRLSLIKGGSYMRLLDQEIMLNLVKLDGTDISAIAINNLGNVGIGTLTPAEKLSVNGKIRAQEIKVETANWPDYVFEPDYKPLSLRELEAFIMKNKHLPEIPKAEVLEKEGLNLGEMNKLLLKKIEELTLHLIQKESEIKAQDERIRKLEEIILK